MSRPQRSIQAPIIVGISFLVGGLALILVLLTVAGTSCHVEGPCSRSIPHVYCQTSCDC